MAEELARCRALVEDASPSNCDGMLCLPDVLLCRRTTSTSSFFTVDIIYARMAISTSVLGNEPPRYTDAAASSLTPMVQSKLDAYTAQQQQSLAATIQKAVRQEASRVGLSLEGATAPVRTLTVTPVLPFSVVRGQGIMAFDRECTYVAITYTEGHIEFITSLTHGHHSVRMMLNMCCRQHPCTVFPLHYHAVCGALQKICSSMKVMFCA